MAAFAGPFGAMVMLLLSAPVALGSFRSTQGAMLLVSGLAAGLLFLVVNGLLTALGEGGAMSPFLAVWGAPVIFGALARHRSRGSGGLMPFDSTTPTSRSSPSRRPAELQRFIALPNRLNAKDPNWITPLMMERTEALTPEDQPVLRSTPRCSCGWPCAAAATSAGSAPRSTPWPRRPRVRRPAISA
jgi:hypothetical protein